MSLQHTTALCQQTRITGFLSFATAIHSLCTTRRITHLQPLVHQQLLYAFSVHQSHLFFIPVILERIQHEGNMDHSIVFTFTPFQRLRTVRELPLTTRMPRTTAPTSSLRWRTLRTNATPLIVLTVPTVSLPLWILLHTSLHPHAVEEQDARQCQQQEADRATYMGAVNSSCILTYRSTAMKQESQVWGEKPSYRNWNTGEEWTHQVLQNSVNGWTGEGITVKIVRGQEMK